MIDLSELFPKPMGKPIVASVALNNIVTRNDLTEDQLKWWGKIKPGQSASYAHPKGHWFNFVKLDKDRTCGTVPKASGNAKFCYWDEPKGLSIDGYKRLGSFPDAFLMSGNYGKDKNRIGNSVPPLMAYAIAAQISYKLWGGCEPIAMTKEIDYPAHLEMMWQRAIAPREPNAPKVISTFAGGGGSLTGYMMAGYDDILAVEWDDNAVETLRLNWPDLDIYHGDIAKLTVEEVLRRTGLAVGELDLLDGSPPCQGFSTAGKRMMDDPRNQLFREYVRLLRGLRPKVFVMENVSGMVKGKMKLVFVEILKELKASGYRVKACLLNAKYFHVPQSRERMIFIGVRDDLGVEPSHPKGEHAPITPRMAIGELEPDEYDSFPDWLINAADEIEAGNYNHKSVLRAFEKHKGTTGGSQSFKLLSWDRESCTIAKIWPGAAGVGHPSRNRYLASNELKRIGSFPDGYQFIGGYKKTIERIGNSIPPLFMEAIARHIRKEILGNLT